MGKQTFDRAKKTLAILLAVCFVATLTATTVSAQALQASFSASYPTLQFIDHSTGLPNYWYWNFGDGTYSTYQNPIHSYTDGACQHYVTLTVSNLSGSTSTTGYVHT